MRPLLRAPNQGFFSLISTFHNVTGTYYYLRALDLVYFPAVYWIGGFSPWKYQLVYLALESVTILCFFNAFRLATKDNALSFLTILLYACYPSHGATHHCFLGPFTPSMTFFAAALLFHVLWLESSGALPLLGSLLCFSLGALLYEAVVPLILLMPLLSLLRSLRQERSWRQSWRNALAGSLPIFAAAILLIVYNVAIQRIFPLTISRKIIIEPLFALRVLGKGFECSFTGLADLLRRSIVPAVHDLPPYLWLLGAAAIAGLAWVLPAGARRLLQSSLPRRVWLWGAALAFAAAYAPYAVSADRYVPHLFDVQNRINGAASLPAAMLAAYALDLLGPAARRWALTALLSAFTIINWQSGWDWAQSWSIQSGILEGAARPLAGLRGGPATVYLEGAPESVGTAPLLNGDWAFDAAMQDVTLRSDLHGAIWRGSSSRGLAHPAGREFVYHFGTGRLEPLGSN